MWLLIHSQSPQGETAYCLEPDMDYSIGRIACDITTVWENSISKKHAIVRVPATQGTPSVRDLSSFGTFVNDKKLSNDSESIKEGDQIVLGIQSRLSGTYTLRWRPVVLCCSQMTPSHLLTFKATAIRANISVLDTWDVTVTHLVVGELKTTQKVMCAVAKGVPIVDESWVEGLIDSIKKLHPIPLASDHLPTLASACQVSGASLFLSDPRRGKLFDGNRFYFLDTLEYQQLNVPISYCGGASTLVDVSDVMFATFDRYASPEAVVVSGNKDRFCSVPGGTEFISLLELAIEKAGRSLVEESQIIHSIINVATDNIFSQPLSPSPLQVSNLSHCPSQSPKKREHSCMLSLFDEENIIHLDYPSSQSVCKSQSCQLQAILPSNIIADTVIKCEVSTDNSPSVIPFREQDATRHTLSWLPYSDTNCDTRVGQVSAARTPSQFSMSQDEMYAVKNGYRIIRKCFVKTPSLCSIKYGHLKSFIRVTGNSVTHITQPMTPLPFPSESQCISTPKCKRKSSETLQTTKRSLIIDRDDSDSEDEKYLAVTPLH